MNNQHKIKPFLITLLVCGTTPLAADAEPAAEPAPWHVPDAAVRVPVTVSPASAERFLGRIPPDVYLSELKPIKADGLTFLPETTNAPMEKNKKGNYKPDRNGTATYALKPEYTHFSCWLATGGGTRPLTVSFDEGKTFVQMKHGGREGNDASVLMRCLFDRTMTDEDMIGVAAVHPHPAGVKDDHT